MRHILLFTLSLVFVSCLGSVHSDAPAKVDSVIKNPDYIYECASEWVDSVYMNLSPDERIAQLFWIAIENTNNKATYQHYLKQIEQYKPGGILLLSMSPLNAVEVVSEMQKLSEISLLVSVDGENGLAMRFPGVVAFPNAMSLGAIKDDELIYKMGLDIARQCKVLGIHVNLAPVADVNVNPDNPIIGSRSFGEDSKNVARKAVSYMKGLQDGGVMAVGKHFPGHGDTDKDSHKTLPLVQHNRQQLDSVDLLPFDAMIDSGLWGIMSAHIEVPALEKKRGIPASFSKSILVSELRNSMGFRGLVISDAVNMQGAKTMGRPGVVDALALVAGNDVVEFTEDLSAAIFQVKRAIDNGKLTWNDIEEKCRRTLAFKHYLIDNQTQNILNADSLNVALNTYEARNLNSRLYEASLTVLKNNQVFPLVLNKDEKTACIVVGEAPVFIEGFVKHFDIPVFELSSTDGLAFDKTLALASKFNRYILVVADSRWGRQKVNNARQARLMQLALNDCSLALFMGNAYHLRDWNKLRDVAGLAVVYQNSEEAQQAMLSFLFGEFNATGRLPVSIEGLFNVGDGIDVEFDNITLPSL